jgi:hypothetical protein
MDKEFQFQQQFIWKHTEHDGVLPITNFTEEVNESNAKKRGKDKAVNKELG